MEWLWQIYRKFGPRAIVIILILEGNLTNFMSNDGQALPDIKPKIVRARHRGAQAPPLRPPLPPATASRSGWDSGLALRQKPSARAPPPARVPLSAPAEFLADPEALMQREGHVGDCDVRLFGLKPEPLGPPYCTRKAWGLATDARVPHPHLLQR